MDPAYLHDLHAERLEPGEKSLQGRLVPERAVQNRLYWLHRGLKRVEIKQRLGWNDPSDADLVVGQWHRSPQPVAMGSSRISTIPPSGRTAHHAPRVNRHPGEIPQRVMTNHPHPRQR